MSREKFFRCTALLFFIVLFGVPFGFPANHCNSAKYEDTENISIEKTMAFKSCNALHNKFREKYRFHYQTLAMESFPDSSRLILIAEPAPYFDLNDISKIFSPLKFKVKIYSHKVGYDGAISDIAIILSQATNEDLHNRLPLLSKALYKTNYKCFTEKLSNMPSRVYYADNNLDYHITLEELNKWFLVDKETFSKDGSSAIFTVKSIFQKKARGVFFSTVPGFVAWALPKNSDISRYLPDIRKFVLDADLILGAIADKSTLVIIGRERECALNVLPPLQVESVMLLASVSQKELSQSLDINDFMVGKMPDGWDWCPTYLSTELENTEFGHLMTITDILLKSWSESGTIKEKDYNYPAPKYYPFDEPLFSKLKLNELVYNWNTKDVMYAIDTKGLTIYSLNHTGALPVSYFNSQYSGESVGNSYENQAYHYFCTLGNTDLARVVQYTALYQLFIDNNIRCSAYKYSSFPKNKPFLLAGAVKNTLDTLKKMQTTDIELFTNKVSEKIFFDIQKSEIDRQLAINEQVQSGFYSQEQRNLIYQNLQNNTKADLKQKITELQQIIKPLSTNNYNTLVRILAYPRGNFVYNKTTQNLFAKSRKINTLMNNLGKNNLAIIGIDLKAIRDYYVRSLRTSSGKYVKTPSIIMTYNGFYATGGHNLSSKISRVKKMNGYERNTSEVRDYTGQPASPKVERQTANTEPFSNETPNTKTTKPQHKPSKVKNTTPNKIQNKTAPSAKKEKNISEPIQQTKSSVRSRSEVISTTPREHRGFCAT